MELNLEGKKVLITGGSRGIGRACAEVLALEGCKLVLVAREELTLKKAQAEIKERYGTDVDLCAMDLSVQENIIPLVDLHPDIEVLVNNAGAIPRGDLFQIEDHTWRKAWDLKVFGYINLCRAYYPLMKRRNGGVIINIIGAAGERPRMDYIAGGAGNAALMAFTKALGARSLADGIRVVGVNPGLMETERLERQMRILAETRFGNPDRWRELIPKNPPPGDPKDVAHLVAFLVSEKAKYITGTVITIDGGISAL
ncbi:MAG: short-chain dehydrogenase/reductase [Syntrophales bacterium]|nr:short-chain dehydrogenase/reductase [Syntrophales bacterium]